MELALRTLPEVILCSGPVASGTMSGEITFGRTKGNLNIRNT